MIRPSSLFLALVLAVLATTCFPGASFARDAAFIPPDAPANVGQEAVKAAPKEIKQINFGVVEVGGEKSVRSTIIVNDSSEPITIRSIEMIEANNGLQRLDQGCVIGKELAPGASCPVVLQWEPKAVGTVSTDLVIHHSGKIGFTVVAVRGEAKEPALVSPVAASKAEAKTEKSASGNPEALTPLPQNVNPVSAVSRKGNSIAGKSKSAKGHSVGIGSLYLIGTVGNRAVFLLPSGDTCVVPAGENVEMGEGTAKLIFVSPYSADIMVGGQKRTLLLKAAPSVGAKGAKQVDHRGALKQKNGSRSGNNKK